MSNAISIKAQGSKSQSPLMQIVSVLNSKCPSKNIKFFTLKAQMENRKWEKIYSIPLTFFLLKGTIIKYRLKEITFYN